MTEIIRLAEKKGLVCPLEDEMTDKWIEEFLFPEKSLKASGRQPLNFDYIHKELAKPNVTLSLLHHEYEAECRANEKIPYSYRSFLRHNRSYANKYKATLRIRRKPGEIMEVDWVGSTAVSTFPCSQLSYAEATLSMDLHAWITAHNHAFEYFGGTTQIIVQDNLKASVTKHTSRELVLNPTCREMAEHYRAVVMPARVRSPKDYPEVFIIPNYGCY